MMSEDRLYVGTLSVQDVEAGLWLDIEEGGPADAVPVVRGKRVLIPGRVGLYTPPAAFEADHLVIRLKGTVWGVGETPAARRVAFREAMQSLFTACDVEAREDVTITAHGPYEGLGTGGEATIDAGFLRLIGPRSVGMESREIELHFEATDPPAWDVSDGS